VNFLEDHNLTLVGTIVVVALLTGTMIDVAKRGAHSVYSYVKADLGMDRFEGVFAHRRMDFRCTNADVGHVMASLTMGCPVVHFDMVHCSMFCDVLLGRKLHLRWDWSSRSVRHTLELHLDDMIGGQRYQASVTIRL